MGKKKPGLGGFKKGTLPVVSSGTTIRSLPRPRAPAKPLPMIKLPKLKIISTPLFPSTIKKTRRTRPVMTTPAIEIPSRKMYAIRHVYTQAWVSAAKKMQFHRDFDRAALYLTKVSADEYARRLRKRMCDSGSYEIDHSYMYLEKDQLTIEVVPLIVKPEQQITPA